MANKNSSDSVIKPADTKLATPQMTFAEAKTKVNDRYSGLKLLSLVHHIPLPPRFLSNIRAGIREQLNAHINVYNESTNGVLVAYSNVKAMQQTGMILGDDPYIHFKVRADAVYFQPQPGELLSGVVNKVGKDHIGGLVHGSFNVSLRKPRKDCRVKVGDEVVFEVLQTTPHAGLLAISGRLQQGESSSAKRRRTDSSNAETDAKSEKRRKRDDTLDLSRILNQEPIAGSSIDFRSEKVDERVTTIKTERLHESVLLDSTVDTSQNETCHGELSSKKKKKKKRKSSQSELVSPVDGNAEVSVNRTDDTGPKKKKRRSSQSVSDSTMDDTLDTSQNETFDDGSSKPKKRKKKKKAKSEVNEEQHSGEFETSQLTWPVEQRPSSPQSIDSAIGSLTNGMDSVHLKLEASWGGGESREGVSSAKKKKKKKKKTST